MTAGRALAHQQKTKPRRGRGSLYEKGARGGSLLIRQWLRLVSRMSCRRAPAGVAELFQPRFKSFPQLAQLTQPACLMRLARPTIELRRPLGQNGFARFTIKLGWALGRDRLARLASKLMRELGPNRL